MPTRWDNPLTTRRALNFRIDPSPDKCDLMLKTHVHAMASLSAGSSCSVHALESVDCSYALFTASNQ